MGAPVGTLIGGAEINSQLIVKPTITQVGIELLIPKVAVLIVIASLGHEVPVKTFRGSSHLHVYSTRYRIGIHVRCNGLENLNALKRELGNTPQTGIPAFPFVGRDLNTIK